MTREQMTYFDNLITQIDDWWLYLRNPFLYHSQKKIKNELANKIDTNLFDNIFLRRNNEEQLKSEMLDILLNNHEAWEKLGDKPGGEELWNIGSSITITVLSNVDKWDLTDKLLPELLNKAKEIHELIGQGDNLVLDGKYYLYYPDVIKEKKDMFDDLVVESDKSKWHKWVQKGIQFEVDDKDFDDHECFDFQFDDTEGYGCGCPKIVGGLCVYNKDWVKIGKLKVLDLQDNNGLRGLVSAVCLITSLYNFARYRFISANIVKIFGRTDIEIYNSDLKKCFSFNDITDSSASIWLRDVFDGIFYDKFMIKKYLPYELYSKPEIFKNIKNVQDYLDFIEKVNPGCIDFFKRNVKELEIAFPGLNDMLCDKMGIGSDYWFDEFDFKKDLTPPEYASDKTKFSRFCEYSDKLHEFVDNKAL